MATFGSLQARKSGQGSGNGIDDHRGRGAVERWLPRVVPLWAGRSSLPAARGTESGRMSSADGRRPMPSLRLSLAALTILTLLASVGAAVVAVGPSRAAGPANSAVATGPGTCTYDGTTNTITLNSGTWTLSQISSDPVCGSAPLAMVAPGVWYLQANLTLESGATLQLHGTAVGGDVDTLRIQSAKVNPTTLQPDYSPTTSNAHHRRVRHDRRRLGDRRVVVTPAATSRPMSPLRRTRPTPRRPEVERSSPPSRARWPTHVARFGRAVGHGHPQQHLPVPRLLRAG